MITHKDIHNLIVEIHGKKKTKKGYAYIKGVFGDSRLEGMNQKLLDEIHSCFLSRKEKTVCPIHGRIHNPFKGLFINNKPIKKDETNTR